MYTSWSCLLIVSITAAQDTQSGQMLKVAEAKAMNILDMDKHAFQDLKSRKWMLIGDAVDLGLVEIDYDMDAAGAYIRSIIELYAYKTGYMLLIIYGWAKIGRKHCKIFTFESFSCLSNPNF